jgi:hypothetical protein
MTSIVEDLEQQAIETNHRAYTAYVDALEECLIVFQQSKEWADLISSLTMVRFLFHCCCDCMMTQTHFHFMFLSNHA